MTNEPQEETMDQTEQTQEKLSIDDLHPKMELEGTVTKVELFGAFVDIGVGRDGLVHISQLQEGRVNRVEDVVKPGDTVTVWVSKVEPKLGRIDLTMIEPPGISWSELRKGQTYTGKVVRIEKFGVFVDIGAERPGLVHISEMARGYVGDPSDVVTIGDEIEVKLIDFDKRKKRIDLSMKDSTAPEPVQEAEAEEERLPTAMELAMRAAMSGRNARDADRRKSGEDRRRVQRAQQEDILSRTLRQRSK